jgi:hypothetical protein
VIVAIEPGKLAELSDDARHTLMKFIHKGFEARREVCSGLRLQRPPQSARHHLHEIGD